MRVIFGATPQVHGAIAAWVGKRIPFVGEQGFGNCVGASALSNDGKVLAGVVFHDYQPQFSTLAFSIAADSPRWATRKIVHQFLAYPFEQAKVDKLWTATPMSNERALRLVKGVGFTREGILARHFGEFGHAVISRMFRSDYERLYGELHHG